MALTVCLAPVLQSQETVVALPSGYSKLVFNDEFNGEGLPDQTKWEFEEGYVRNGEKQYYTANRLENCYQKNGMLHLVALNDSALIKGEKQAVTSASICTKNKHMWTYCRVEVRAKLPMCLGTWPAIWMMPNDDKYGGWPRSGEIDILEHVGYEPNDVHYAIHTEKYNHMHDTQKRHTVPCPSSFTDFHVYAMEWHPDRIEWHLDGEIKFVVKNNENTWDAWPFNHPFYLILNLAFGGGWGGREGINLEGLPQSYVIDYVRVFQ